MKHGSLFVRLCVVGMQIDDDVRLRFLQAQRRIRSLAQGEADDGFTADNVEAELHLFERLADDEAFDDWLNMGVPTTVESTIADAESRRKDALKAAAEEARMEADEMSAASDSWSDFRTILLKRLDRKESAHNLKAGTAAAAAASPEAPRRREVQFMDGLGAIYSVMARTNAVLDDFFRVHGHDGSNGFINAIRLALRRCNPVPLLPGTSACTVLCDGYMTIDVHFGAEIEIGDEAHATATTLCRIAEDASDKAFELQIVCDSAAENAAALFAQSEADALAREDCVACSLQHLEAVRELGESVLQLRLAANFASRFRDLRRPWIQSVNTKLQHIGDTFQRISSEKFEARHDATEAFDPELAATIGSLVHEINDIAAAPLGLDGHIVWRRQFLDAAFRCVNLLVSQHISLNMSEIHIACGTRKTAERVKQWAGMGLTLPEVAYRQLRHDNFRLGAAVCVSARYLLGELSAEHDAAWGFSYW
jgi:hypothetical protein